uniref:methyl-CpG-binding domain-containing protein 10-like n=1 Tax=Erigeron canadensis TaxID=72917 RepID=UPI001CB9A9B3|nr:methyl-CpG-binding domain-containing protein 10-like [Erigeron canadensis]
MNQKCRIPIPYRSRPNPGTEKWYKPKLGQELFVSQNSVLFGIWNRNPGPVQFWYRSRTGGPLLAKFGIGSGTKFDWASGETTRQSTRISEKLKSPKKRARKSSSSKKGNAENEELIQAITEINIEMKKDEKTEKDNEKQEERDGNIPEVTEETS